MMLDAKRTFDELIDLLAPDATTREEILSNRIYQELSSAVAGSQEFTAVAKLYELNASGRFDAIVLDTPPSRSALDFLDAPQRLTGFLEGRALKVLTVPTGAAAAIAARGSGLVFSALRRVTGVDLLADLSTFFRVLSDVVEGLAERASAVNRLLGDPATTFLIVTSPEPEPAREAAYLAERLAAEGMPRGELIVNRVHSDGLQGHSVEDVARLLAGELGEGLAARAASNLADFDVLVRRDEQTIARMSDSLGEREPVLVPHLDEDVQDLLGLARIAEHLFG
jgi:anion-transporting  ArsA/GET3 family ATPase